MDKVKVAVIGAGVRGTYAYAPKKEEEIYFLRYII